MQKKHFRCKTSTFFCIKTVYAEEQKTLKVAFSICTQTVYPVTIVIENCVLESGMKAKIPSSAQHWAGETEGVNKEMTESFNNFKITLILHFWK